MPRSRTKGRLAYAAPPTSVSHTVPASVGGVDALSSLSGMPADTCFYTFNLMPSEYGLRLRMGYREWAVGIGTTHFETRTILPFEGQTQDPANDRLFAVTQDGIYDITLFNTDTPTQDVTFLNNSADAGYGVFTEFTTDAGDQILYYADALNGLHSYTEGTGLWTIPAFSGGPAMSAIEFVTVHKQRIWFAERDSSIGYYSEVGAIAGTLTPFHFGNKFKHGGNLMGLWSWTVDGGDGVDDLLVVLSRGGDVLIYKGEDPALIDPASTNIPWSLIGSWFIGEIPETRRAVQEYGGDFFILSTFGLVSLGDLLQGVAASDARASPSAKINRVLRQRVIDRKDAFGWSINTHPADGFLQIVEPYVTAKDARQYNMNLLTRAWGFWSDVPMLCGQTWNGDYFIGGAEGQVWIYDGALDDTTLEGVQGDPIDFEILTSFQPYGNSANFKQVGLIRPIGVTAGLTNFRVAAVYDYNIEETIPSPPPVEPGGTDNVWDTGLWDFARWDFALSGESLPLGAGGIGRTIAVAANGSSSARITIVAWDINIIHEGGFL